LGRITGVVVSASTFEPLADVQVYLVGANLGSMSRQNGQFVILNVPPGTYELRAERIGLSTVTTDITVASGASLERTFVLTPRNLRLDDVVVTGTAGAARRREIAAAEGVVRTRVDEFGVGQANAPTQLVGRVTGRVVDRVTQAPLVNVQVYLDGLSLGSLTRSTGAFVILNIPAGTYELRAERVGLTLGRREITVVDGEALEVNFELSSQAIGMDEILSDRTPGALAVRESRNPPSPEAQARAAQIPENVPRFTPHTVKPELLNGAEVQGVMRSEYPSVLREAGVRGTAVVWLFIDGNGAVENTKVQTSSGIQALDDAAVVVARSMRFSPALNRDQRVPVWVVIPMTFRPDP
jgi:TonB family protein